MAAHLEERLSWVVKDPARLFAAVESNVRSARERVGPLGFRVLQLVFARLARVVAQGSEYGPTHNREAQPRWLLKSENECWRWLSGDRIVSDQPAIMLSRIFGMCLDEYTFVKGRRAAQGPGSRVVMHAGYVGSELVGAEGVVEAVEERARRAGGRWAEVTWTLTGGDVVREWLPNSVLGGLGRGRSNRNRRRGSCDKCRTKFLSCKHQCQDTSLANDYAKSMPATLSASTMNLRSTRPTVAKRPGKDPGTAAPRKRKSTGAAGEPKKAKAAPSAEQIAVAAELAAASKAHEDALDERVAVCAEVAGGTKLQADLDEANAAVSRAYQSKRALSKAAKELRKAAPI